MDARPLTVALAGLIATAAVAGAEDVAVRDDNDKVNYSIGYQIGGDLKRQGVQLVPEVMVRAIRDALDGSEPLMSDEERRGTLVALSRKLAAKEEEQRREAAVKNLQAGRAFMSENKVRDGVKTLPSGLQYEVLQAGEGPQPSPTGEVTAHYRGTLIDGTEFDSSYSRNQPATFALDRVIVGWQQALPLMKEGARWKLFIPADLAYGDQGAGPKIPPNATLVFEVELLSASGGS